MKVVGLDLGTNCGWSLYNGETWQAGVWVLTPRRHEGAGFRFLRFRQELCNILNRWGVDAIGFEEVRAHSSVDAAHIYGALMGILTAECEARGIPYTSIPVGTIKKRATGKGNAPKVAMIESAWERWPDLKKTIGENDNIADALWCGVCLLEQVL